MRSKALILIASRILLVTPALPFQLVAQDIHYQLVDIPTSGGPAAAGNVDCNECTQFINNRLLIIRELLWAGRIPPYHDPNAPNCGDCFLTHGFRWQDGILTDLGALPGVNFSHATSVSARGWATGGSGTAKMDPQTGNPQEHAVLWKGDEIVDLGTLRAC
jgi:hypothetical protein